MTPQEMIDVIQAHKDGEQIQFLYKTEKPSSEDCWLDAKNPTWNFAVYNYRVKKEPKDLYKYLIYNTATKQYCNTHNYYQYEKTAKEFLTEYQRIIQRLDHTKITIQE